MSPAGTTKESLLDRVSEMWTMRTIRAFGLSTHPVRHGSDSVVLPIMTRFTFSGNSRLLDDNILFSMPANVSQITSTQEQL